MPPEHAPPAHTLHPFLPKRCDYCVIVITLNEGERIRNQLWRMRDYSFTSDIIVVDGNSSDNSIDNALLSDCNVRSLLVTPEIGLCTATRLGIHYALKEGYQGLITVDGNGKDGIEAIPDFVAKLTDGYDLVQGSRFLPGGFHEYTPVDRLIGIRLLVSPLLSFFSGFRYTDPTNAFRAMSARYLKNKNLNPLRNIFIRFNLQFYLVYRAPLLGFRICEIPVKRVYPTNGQIPTKIRGLKIKLLLVYELLNTVLGRYNCNIPDASAQPDPVTHQENATPPSSV